VDTPLWKTAPPKRFPVCAMWLYGKRGFGGSHPHLFSRSRSLASRRAGLWRRRFSWSNTAEASAGRETAAQIACEVNGAVKPSAAGSHRREAPGLLFDITASSLCFRPQTLPCSALRALRLQPPRRLADDWGRLVQKVLADVRDLALNGGNLRFRLFPVLAELHSSPLIALQPLLLLREAICRWKHFPVRERCETNDTQVDSDNGTERMDRLGCFASVRFG
jgi:hypothetical protein